MPQLIAADYCLFYAALLTIFDLRRVCCLFVTDINVPQIVDFRDNVTLSCSYDMSGHTLNSVKWYKDGYEFFSLEQQNEMLKVLDHKLGTGHTDCTPDKDRVIFSTKPLFDVRTSFPENEQQRTTNRSWQVASHSPPPPVICLTSSHFSNSQPFCNCAEAAAASRKSGIYSIQVNNLAKKPFLVSCDEETEGGGWTVIQRRFDGSIDFYRDWHEYKLGFGNLRGEFFIGLDRLHALTTDTPQELLIVMEDFEKARKFARYDAFAIGDESEAYALKLLGTYSGDAGDSLTPHVGEKFSTKDRDNDPNPDSCAVTFTGAWWYKKCHVRYAPLMRPVYLKFPVTGIQLIDDKNYCNVTECRVELSLLGIKSTGNYKCEVSGDAPHFKLTARAANMTVAALPQNNPLISSFHSIYRFDDFVQANCTTDFASLPVTLTWYVNGEKAAYTDLMPSIETTIPAHDYNLRRKVLQLNFYANEPRFYGNPDDGGEQEGGYSEASAEPRRTLELKCVAEIANYPELRRETVLNAVLLHDEDLHNQKLVNSAASHPHDYSPTSTTLLLLLLMLLSTTRSNSRYTTANSSRASTHPVGKLTKTCCFPLSLPS